MTIVTPGFFEHWKTRTLINLLGNDSLAPTYVIRLWLQCHSSRTSFFADLSVETVKSICWYAGEAKKLNDALIESRFIRRDGDAVEVLGWAEHNASLITRWENGAKGGRPRNNRSIPSVSRGLPDKSREDGEEGEEEELKRKEHVAKEAPGFDVFWNAWPDGGRKESKEHCRVAWLNGGCEAETEHIVKHVEEKKVSEQWTTDRGSYVPAPLTYIEERRWVGTKPAAVDEAQRALARVRLVTGKKSLQLSPDRTRILDMAIEGHWYDFQGKRHTPFPI
jgi:hypothetical protein